MKVYYQQLSGEEKRKLDADMYAYTRQFIDQYGAENLDIVEHKLLLKLQELAADIEKSLARADILTPRLPVYAFKPPVGPVPPVYTAAYQQVVLNGAHPP